MHSLAEQTYPRFEVIIVDGGSTDDTLSIVEGYVGDGDVKLIKLEPNLGIARALNAGINVAKGQFIARMDADDVAYPDRLADQVRFFMRLPEVFLLGTGVDTFWARVDSHQGPPWHWDIVHSYLINNPFFHPTVMFHRSLYDEGLLWYDESQEVDEDYELWGRLIRKTVCANLEKNLLRYRIHSDNGQWDPRKHRSKYRALQGFCDSWGIVDPFLIESLVEFQCSNFLRYDDYVVLHNYAIRARKEELPRLGWIDEALLREDNYKAFMAWYRTQKGWRIFS